MTEVEPRNEENVKHPAEENPLYLLATIYGEPGKRDTDLKIKNRAAWNRYMATRFQDKYPSVVRADILDRIERPAPFTPQEVDQLERAFSLRKPAHLDLKIFDLDLKEMDLGGAQLDFEGIEFDKKVSFDQYWFPVFTSFRGATFLKGGSFSSAVFSEGAWFPDVCFSDIASFNKAIFSQGAWFRNVTFSKGAWFEGATFLVETQFNGGTFLGSAHFRQASFSGLALFTGTNFSGSASFNGATFSNESVFEDAIFASEARFNNAKLSGNSLFTNATFSGAVSFDDVVFSKRAWFKNAEFFSEVSFINAEMKGPTSFGASFRNSPPDFSGAKLHEGTDWYRAEWPSEAKDLEQAVRFVQAYERLKLEMDRLKKHEDELDFFAREMQSRRVLRGGWKGLPIGVYELISDFGRSYLRPLLGLFITVVPGALPFWLYFGPFNLTEAVGLSLANAFGALGFRKDFIDPEVIEALPSVLKVWSGVQSIVGAILLFLLGLALRNRMRMK
ncbi:pentapeptide repeat-containing protein [Microvirga sp. 0TCS3.31]